MLPAQLLAQPAIAADLLERGRQATLPGDPRRGVFTARLTAALRLLRRPDDLISLGSEALTSVTEPSQIGEIAWNLARGYQMIPGRGQEGITVIDGVLDGPDTGTPWRSRLRAERALLLATTGRGSESVAEAELAILAGERDEDAVTVGWSLIALLQMASGTDALEFVERGLAIMRGDDPESVDLRLLFLANQLVVLSNLHRTADFEAALRPTVALAEDLGTPRITEIQLGAADHFRRCGDWDQALFYLGQIEAYTPYQSLSKHGMAALIHAHRGDLAATATHLAVVDDIPYTSGLDYMIAAASLIVARAMAAEAEGDTASAVQVLVAWLDPRVEQSAHARSERAEALRELVRLALARGDRVTAERAAAAASDDAPANEDAAQMASVYRGMLDGDPAPLLLGADHFEKNGRPLQAAFAAEHAAAMFAEHSDVDAAKAAFGRAVRMYEQLGATVDLRRVRARLRPYGIRLGPRSSHRRVATGWDALTAAERGVAALVAEGRSNPEIAARLYLSRRTVDAHVAHILHKLQVHSRVEITHEVCRHSTTSA
jgi:DNA-binding CsgD family transcriptional regulator